MKFGPLSFKRNPEGLLGRLDSFLPGYFGYFCCWLLTTVCSIISIVEIRYAESLQHSKKTMLAVRLRIGHRFRAAITGIIFLNIPSIGLADFFNIEPTMSILSVYCVNGGKRCVHLISRNE